jgi:hypothetical protein
MIYIEFLLKNYCFFLKKIIILILINFFLDFFHCIVNKEFTLKNCIMEVDFFKKYVLKVHVTVFFFFIIFL